MVARIDGTPHEPGGDAATGATPSDSTSHAPAEPTAARSDGSVGTTPPEGGAT